MKTLDIAGKDLLLSFRKVTFLAFGFVIPLLVAGIFYVTLGGAGSGQRSFDIPQTKVQIVNQDQPDSRLDNSSVGQILVAALQSPTMSELMQVTVVADPAAARSAVDRQQAGVAVIIPPGFTAALFNPQGTAQVELYQDPTLTIGPGVVHSVVGEIVDSLAGSKIAVALAAGDLSARGAAVDAATTQAVATQFLHWASALGQGRDQGASPYLAVRAPATPGQQPPSTKTATIGLIMAGMMVFFLFFTGAASAQSLLQEDEEGTLARLFTTPTGHSAVLAGRVLATSALLAVQTTVLLVLSWLIFGLNWGPPWLMALVALGMTVLSASFGLFVTSLIRSERQAGAVYGGVMTIMGMLGMMSVFSGFTSGTSQGTLGIVPLFVPQGWAVRGWQLLLQGRGAVDVLPVVAVMLGLGAILFAAGLLRFRRRFA